jgi:hypothetical protein
MGKDLPIFMSYEHCFMQFLYKTTVYETQHLVRFRELPGSELDPEVWLP